jgi:putative methylase
MMLERLEALVGLFSREQYATPASVAAEMLSWRECARAWHVCDLGCGTGVLAIGAALLGARAIGVEIDGEALAIARRNAEKLNVDVDFIRADVRSLVLKGIDTVVMNPPFGAQKASSGDRAFLCNARKIAKTIYSLHNQGSEDFVRSFMKPCTVQEIYRIPFPLKRCFEFHSQDVKIIEVELYRITCQTLDTSNSRC